MRLPKRPLSVDNSLSGSELVLQYRLTFIDNLPRRMIENKKEADRMVAEDTLMFKEGHAKGHADGDRERAEKMVRNLHKENVSTSVISKAAEISEDEVLRILSEE